ncbi:MAG: PHP domain-containing protein [Dehalobacterium sp.]
MFADLHIHSSYSDGTDSPEELIDIARDRGIKVLSLVDHDTVQGLDEFSYAGRKHGVQTIPGVEISTSVKGVRIHILGYGIEYQNKLLVEFLSKLSKARTENTRLVLARLNQLNLLNYPWEKVVEHNQGRKWIHSSHVFRSMVKDGYYSSFDQWLEFYYRYFGRYSPAYLDIDEFTPEKGIQVIKEAGGIPVLAHPKLIGDDSKLLHLKNYGLRGVEVYYPAHSQEDIKRYRELVERYKLIITGGTDWHGQGTEWPVSMGDYGIDEDSLSVLMTANKNN